MPSSPAESGRSRLPSPGKLVAGAGAFVALAAGVTGLLFTLDPGLQPCLGGSHATLTASVFPGERKRDFLIRGGTSPEQAQTVPNRTGAVVRYTIGTDGYRGHTLAVAYTLFTVGADGVLGPVVAGEDRNPDKAFTPQSCSDAEGQDAFVPVPALHRRYRILLELFRDAQLTDRVALFETETFRD